MDNGDKDILIIAMGNDLLGDDGLAIEAAACLRQRLPETITIEEVFGGGLELLDLMEGRGKVLFLDSIITGVHKAGTIMEIDPDKLSEYQAYSPHYIGLPDVLRLGNELSIAMPSDIRILCMEIEPSDSIRQGLSSDISSGLEQFCRSSLDIINDWIKQTN